MNSEESCKPGFDFPPLTILLTLLTIWGGRAEGGGRKILQSCSN